MAWLEETTDGVLLRLYVQPRASKTEVVGVHGTPPEERLKIRIAAPPVDGEANEEVLRFLKKTLGLPSSALALVRGDSSRTKDVVCRGVSSSSVAKALGVAAQ